LEQEQRAKETLDGLNDQVARKKAEAAADREKEAEDAKRAVLL
jgi:hypothetical protein